ncbi:uncharacterized protein PG986_011303 [Apiospora aurea]|uniref:RING-type domain-containing protein n=1 Tax=Apiospora aurea TaxID=335848 RepID=A0ABR1Q4R2_9PEZI
MSAPTPAEHGSSPPNPETIHTAVGLSIAVFVLAVIGIWHIGRKTGSSRSSRRRRAIPTRRPQPEILGLDGSLGQSAVDKIPIIKYHNNWPSPECPRNSHNLWPGQAKPQPPTDRTALPPPLPTRLWRLIRRYRDEEEPHMSTCSICTEDFRQGAKLRHLPCGHLFHPACIDPWLCKQSRTCPLWYARKPLSKPPTNTGLTSPCGILEKSDRLGSPGHLGSHAQAASREDSHGDPFGSRAHGRL